MSNRVQVLYKDICRLSSKKEKRIAVVASALISLMLLMLLVWGGEITSQYYSEVHMVQSVLFVTGVHYLFFKELIFIQLAKYVFLLMPICTLYRRDRRIIEDNKLLASKVLAIITSEELSVLQSKLAPEDHYLFQCVVVKLPGQINELFSSPASSVLTLYFVKLYIECK